MSEEALKTKSQFPAWCMDWPDGKDDAAHDCAVLAEITDVKENGEVELSFSVGKRRLYLTFRQRDLLRAIKEGA